MTGRWWEQDPVQVSDRDSEDRWRPVSPSPAIARLCGFAPVSVGEIARAAATVLGYDDRYCERYLEQLWVRMIGPIEHMYAGGFDDISGRVGRAVDVLEDFDTFDVAELFGVDGRFVDKGVRVKDVPREVRRMIRAQLGERLIKHVRPAPKVDLPIGPIRSAGPSSRLDV